MPTPAPTVFTVKANKRLLGSEVHIIAEAHTVPAVSPYVVKLAEIPLGGDPVRAIAIDCYGFGALVEVNVNTPENGFFYVDYAAGYLYFNSAQYGSSITVDYYGTGSIVAAEDMNLVQSAINAVETTTETVTSDNVDFSFPRDVGVTRNLTITGDLIVNGATTSIETANTSIKDKLITLNDGATLAGTTNSGIEVFRGTGNNMPSLQWVEDPSHASAGYWKVVGTVDSSTVIAFGELRISLSRKLKTLTADESTLPALVAADIGSIYYDSISNQFKGIKDDGAGNPVIVILG